MKIVTDFDDMLDSIYANMEQNTSTDFVNYISTKVVPLLRQNLIAGHPGWNSNNVESANNQFKHAVDWQPKKLPDLINILQEMVQSQLKDSYRALYGRGDYKLRPSHIHCHISAEKWASMSKADGTKLVRKSFVLDPSKKTVASSNGKLTVISQPGAGKKQNQRKRIRCAKTFTPTSKKRKCD